MDSNIVKTRLGHYWVPGGGVYTALVVGRNSDTVNVVTWDSDGDMRPHVAVPVTGEANATSDHATFHLVSSCPIGCPENVLVQARS